LPSWGTFGLLGLAGALCFAALVLARRAPTIAVRRPGGAVELLFVFALYLGTIVLTVTSDRARLPLLVLLAPFGGWLFVVAWTLARERRWRALLLPALGLCASATFVHLPALPADERAKDMDEREYNLCVVLRDQAGGEEQARQRAAALAERHPRSARLRLLLAELDFRAAARRKDGARLEELARLGEAWCAGEALVPRERFRACALAAWCRLELGEGAAALAAFASARQFDGDALDLRLGSARALLLLAESEPARRAERAQEAELLLRGAAADHEARLLLAQAAFERARSLERGSPVAVQATREALARLEPLALSDSAPRSVRAEARRLAGWIQLWLGNAKSAANHFRAALDLGDAGTAELGLVSALLARAEAGEQDAALLAEVDGRLQAMPVPGGPALDELRARRERLGGARR
jgi:tetratricopeptide (TPR) repeat protein